VTQSSDALSATGAVQRAQANLAKQGARLGASSHDAFVARGKAIVDADGTEHVRFDRSFKGLPVLGGDIVVHGRKSGELKSFSATLRNDLKDLDVAPAFDTAHAVELASAAFAGTQYNASAELIINAHGRAPALAYEVVINGQLTDGSPSELHVLVDAKTGQIQDRFDGIETGKPGGGGGHGGGGGGGGGGGATPTAATGTGHSLYLGTVSIPTQNDNNGVFEMNAFGAGSFYTLNMGGKQSGGSVLVDSDNVWGDGTNSDPASAGVDAHFGQLATLQYYKNVHGRNGIDGAGNVGYSRVHYGRRYNNAFWSDSCFCMTYGDGDGSSLSPLVSLDVAGHEMTHGITSRSANLTYSGESGGLNESTSDVFGTAVEHYAAANLGSSDAPDFLIGETIYTPSRSGDALRYMSQPSLDGTSADCWSSNVGSLDVHYSSGVGNHAFYLLAEGSKPTDGNPQSPTCNGSTVNGVGIDAAAKIWYRALTVYWTSSTNYSAARAGTLQAATDLYGANSSQVAAVAAAWSAVSVN
jgi:Zn-dependent metalloprotease